MSDNTWRTSASNDYHCQDDSQCTHTRQKHIGTHIHTQAHIHTNAYRLFFSKHAK